MSNHFIHYGEPEPEPGTRWIDTLGDTWMHFGDGWAIEGPWDPAVRYWPGSMLGASGRFPMTQVTL